jgi:hypothetical protein
MGQAKIVMAADQVAALHREVDAQTRPLESLHRDRLQCRRGCADCCRDDISVFAIEAEQIRRHYPELLTGASPHPPGACAFLDSAGACRIYPHRPYVCRTQGLPLRWFDELEDGTPIELRDICPLNEEGPPIEALEPEACWSLGPCEGQLATLQAKTDGGTLQRVELRALFTGGSTA